MPKAANMMLVSPVRRLALRVGFLVLAAVPLAQAQDFPSRPVKIVVPYAPGGAADVVGRIVAQEMQAIAGQQFIIENRPGGGGITGVEFVVKSPADGYTLLSADAGHWAINAALYPKLPYDALRDLAPVGMITTLSLFLVAHESMKVDDLKEFIALVKSRPGQFNYGSSGNGSVHHLTMESIKAALGLDIVHVPYKGTGQSTPALVAGQVAMSISALTSIAGHVKSGKVKALLASTRKRFSLVPGVPGTEESGIAGVDFPGEIALLAPGGTPRPIVEKLSAALAKAVQRPDAIARFTAISVEGVGNTPEQLAATIRADIPKYARAVKLSGATVD